MCNRTPALDDVFESTGRWHVHGVNVDLGEQGSRSRNHQRNEDIPCFSSLADLACFDKPCDVIAHKGPPVPKGDKRICRKETVVTCIVMTRLVEGKIICRKPWTWSIQSSKSSSFSGLSPGCGQR
jgi:hypothetical protein